MQKVIKMLIALALLPVNQVDAGFLVNFECFLYVFYEEIILNFFGYNYSISGNSL